MSPESLYNEIQVVDLATSAYKTLRITIAGTAEESNAKYECLDLAMQSKDSENYSALRRTVVHLDDTPITCNNRDYEAIGLDTAEYEKIWHSLPHKKHYTNLVRSVDFVYICIYNFFNLKIS